MTANLTPSPAPPTPEEVAEAASDMAFRLRACGLTGLSDLIDLLVHLEAVQRTAREQEVTDLKAEVERLREKEGEWKGAALRAGVCPACCGWGTSSNQPESCSDCLGTGWLHGDPFQQAKAAEARAAQTGALAGRYRTALAEAARVVRLAAEALGRGEGWRAGAFRTEAAGIELEALAPSPDQPRQPEAEEVQP